MIAVVIPCYRVSRQVVDVIAKIDDKVDLIVCVDDACPEGSGKVIRENFPDAERLVVETHEANLGVGAAVISGYRIALEHNADIIVKIDGDGQMDPRDVGRLIKPIIDGEADYTKGNRFYHPEAIAGMTLVRILGNAGQSFFSKMSSGYWSIFDPANGFTAIHAELVRLLPLDKISPRYFFESDMLFRLGTIRAVVIDIPMQSRYSDENSSMSILHSLATFPFLHCVNMMKRLTYNYLVRDFNIASVNFLLGAPLVVFGLIFGIGTWRQSIVEGSFASAGTVMLAALPIIVGGQFLLNFLAYDIASQPSDPVHRRLIDRT